MENVRQKALRNSKLLGRGLELASGMRMDAQLVELAGRNWLTSQLLGASIEVARPERDRGIDLIAYIDRHNSGKFIACPIQMKAATETFFSLTPKYKQFPGMVLAYVWYINDSAKTTCYALTYREALVIARKIGRTKTESWRTGGRSKQPGYTTTKVGLRLRELLAPYQMASPAKWRNRLIRR